MECYSTHASDPIDTTMITIEEEGAQLQEELVSRVASIEQSVGTANCGGDDATSTSNLVWYDNMIKTNDDTSSHCFI